MNVFMFHFGRCGSTVLGQAISQSPGFFWHGEIFSGRVPVYDGFEALEIAKKQGGGSFNLPEFLDYIVVARIGAIERQVKSVSHYGCEIKGYHFEYGYFSFTLKEALEALSDQFPETRYIFVRRRNSLRRILSASIARQSGVYHVTTPVTIPSKILIDLDNFSDADLNLKGEITAVLRRSAKVEERYAEAIRHLDGVEISYEDHIEYGVERAMELLCAKFGIERGVPVAELARTNPFPLSAMVENFAELQQRLQDTELKSLAE